MALNSSEDNPFGDSVRLGPSDRLDLHGFLPRDIPSVVSEFLSECQRVGVKEVRLIHGKGKGVQRGIVRNLLSQNPLVERYAPASQLFGGEGATIVYLASRPSVGTGNGG